MPSCPLNSHIDRIRHTVKTQPNCMPSKTFSFKKFLEQTYQTPEDYQKKKEIYTEIINYMKDGKLMTSIPLLPHLSLQLMINITNYSWASNSLLPLSLWGSS